MNHEPWTDSFWFFNHFTPCFSHFPCESLSLVNQLIIKLHSNSSNFLANHFNLFISSSIKQVIHPSSFVHSSFILKNKKNKTIIDSTSQAQSSFQLIDSQLPLLTTPHETYIPSISTIFN
ncbi:hypothetical protein O181_042496 [Austropuccinia psidii MF-1]|uniref:Uncharacterized protein n=1 Tax=Austropuccinia psidii MF-1 TaxID=1389203 RepID=A0A9Q3HF67_9BASI|nr:hypothetical protein [Austropuccinia psidii MF-1]